jgi:ADP-heptose:LPS heptosyltransferase
MLGPALRAVKEASPEARLTLLASPAGALAAPLLPWVDEVIVWRSVWQDLGSLPFDPEREATFVDDLRSRGFDGALIFTSFSQTPHAVGYACYLAGIPLRAGESKEFGGGVLTTELRGTPDDLHQVERNLRLVESLGFPAADRSLAVAVGDGERDRVRGLLSGLGINPVAPWVLIHPGASAAARRYPAERWAEVARLLGERGLPVLLTGVEKERETVERAAACAPDAAVFVGETTMEEYAALVEGAALVLCGNTLPMHLADATGRRCWSSSPARTSSPSGHRDRRRSSCSAWETSCYPCHLFSCPIDLPCLDVSPEQVVAEAEGLIRTAPPRSVAPSSNDGKNDRPTGDPVSSTSTPGIPSPGSTVPFETVHRIAVVQALGLGDFLCTTPTLRALRDRFPGASLTFVGSPWAEEAIRRSPLIDRYLPFPGWPGIAEWPVDDGRLDAFLTAARADALISQSRCTARASPAMVSWAHSAQGRRSAIGPERSRTTGSATRCPWVEDESEPLRWLSLVALVGAEPAPTRPEFQVLPPDEERAAMLLEAFDRLGGPARRAACRRQRIRRDDGRPSGFALLARRLVVERVARSSSPAAPAIGN